MSHGHRNVVTRQHIFSCVKEEVSTLMIPCCVGCGEFIDDDTKTVQCEMCVSCETWKYAAGCLDLTDEMYCHLATSSKSNFHWFCEATALEADSCSNDKILSQINGLHSTRGQSNLTKSASRGAHSPVRGHPRGSKVVYTEFLG